MLIKDNSGDWGVCTAAWKGLTTGIPGKPGKYIRYRVGQLKMYWPRIYMNTESIDITFQEHAIKRALEEYLEIRDISKCISSI